MKEMTSLQRCMAVLNGDIPDMLPVIPKVLCSLWKQLE